MRLLVVEDDSKLSSSIKRELAEEQYAVDVAHDGEEGWYLTQLYEYDLILLDIMLPKMNVYVVKRVPFRDST